MSKSEKVIGELANNSIALSLKPKLEQAKREKQQAEAILQQDEHNLEALQQLERAKQRKLLSVKFNID